MQHEAILYSLDPAITKQQILAQESISYDSIRYQRLQERADAQGVQAIYAAEIPKCSAIKPSVYLLYYIGDISLLTKKILGIVGPRRMSIYGQKVIEKVFLHASGYEMATISGMAEGIDQLCHKHSIAQGIPTIAVLGGGLGRYYSRPERELIQQIVDAGGLVLSEFKLSEQPTNYSFPQRNRIIAGLADILFLPEAGKKSGSLITVDFALAMKKPVYATPSSIFSPTSEGVLQLMEAGHVKPIVDIQHFLYQHFPCQRYEEAPQMRPDFSSGEQEILSLLSHNHGVDISALLLTAGMDTDELIQLLTMLEIKGVIAQDRPGEYFLI